MTRNITNALLLIRLGAEKSFVFIFYTFYDKRLHFICSLFRQSGNSDCSQQLGSVYQVNGIQSKQTCNRILTNTHLLNFTERNGNNRRKDNPGAKGYIVLTNNESFIVVCLGKNQQINNGCYKQTAFNNDSSGIPVGKPSAQRRNETAIRLR